MPTVKLGDVVERIKDKIDKDATDLEYYIGGEHFDYGEVVITKRAPLMGSTIGPAFHMRFMPDDVLLMSRNPHLRKAGKVDFEGICSDVSYVCRTKDENVLLQGYLPFVFQTDNFWEFAESNKKGSTNFFLNWSDFARYEFFIPDIEKQRELTDLLWAAADTKSAYQHLLEQTDELVKSQFIEMFEAHSYETVKAGAVFHGMRNGVSASKAGTYRDKLLTLSSITQGSFDADSWKDGFFESCPPEDKRVSNSDFYICRGNGNRSLVGTGEYSIDERPDLVFPDTIIATKIDKERICFPYLCSAWKQQLIRNQIETAARTTNGIYKINQSIISNVEIILPPLQAQLEFAEFIEQTDKSKFELKQAIDSTSGLIRSLMQQDLIN